MPSRLLTTEDVAQRFPTNPDTARNGVTPRSERRGVNVGRRVLFEDVECDRWWKPTRSAALTDS